MSGFCRIWLTCKDRGEADKIANTLLVKRLIACAKQIPVTSDFRWRGKIEHSNEVLLIMDSKMTLFDKIESEIAKLHSYDAFVLQAVPVERVSKQAEDWLNVELKSG